MNKTRIFTFFLIALSISLFSQGTLEDYNRAYSLRNKHTNTVFYTDIDPHWIGNTHYFWYLRKTPEGNFYVLVNAERKSNSKVFNQKMDYVAPVKKHLFDQSDLAKRLKSQTGKEIDYKKLALNSLWVNTTLDSIHFEFDGYRWTYSCSKKPNLIKNKPVVQKKEKFWMEVDDELDGPVVSSPDKKWSAFVRNSNLYVKNQQTNHEKALSFDGSPGEYYSAYIHWSPDSKNIAVMKIRPAKKRFVQFIESSPKDQLQPKLHEREYPKPGDALAQKCPHIFNIETGEHLIPSDELFKNQYMLWGFSWSKDSRNVQFEFNQRGHQAYRVLEMSAESGEIKTLINETSNTFVNYSRYYHLNLDNEKEMIWMSERDNWNHLYLYDRTTGQVKNQITKGEWYVREVLHVDNQKREIIFSANGMVPNEDPYLIRYYKIGMDGKGLKCLTPEKGMHKAWFSQDKKYLVDVYSMVDKAPVTCLRDASNGETIEILETADISRLTLTGWKAPEVFCAKGRDGKTDIWGNIIRPTNFDPNKKYPVIEYIYSGPGNQYVPKDFKAFNAYCSALAELGFIVIQMDGMGTSFRSKAFEEIIHKNLKDAGFPDRIAWTRAAIEKYPYMDSTRIGIFGASAGGQEAMWAVLFHPEHYKAAYSSCGCHDNRMDKIWWNEQWMGYPIGKEYEECSNVVNAHLLTRPLMLVVGELDDNVDPASTMQVADALIKAKKDFELVVIPGSNHTMGGDYGEHKRFDFFVRNLMNVEPPKWGNIQY